MLQLAAGPAAHNNHAQIRRNSAYNHAVTQAQDGRDIAPTTRRWRRRQTTQSMSFIDIELQQQRQCTSKTQRNELLTNNIYNEKFTQYTKTLRGSDPLFMTGLSLTIGIENRLLHLCDPRDTENQY
jgi:hypothetical protein